MKTPSTGDQDLNLTVKMEPHTHLVVNLDILPNQLDLRVRILHQRRETLLNALHLLTDSTQNPLLQSIELVEASPRADLT